MCAKPKCPLDDVDDTPIIVRARGTVPDNDSSFGSSPSLVKPSSSPMPTNPQEGKRNKPASHENRYTQAAINAKQEVLVAPPELPRETTKPTKQCDQHASNNEYISPRNIYFQYQPLGLGTSSGNNKLIDRQSCAYARHATRPHSNTTYSCIKRMRFKPIRILIASRSYTTTRETKVEISDNNGFVSVTAKNSQQEEQTTTAEPSRLLFSRGANCFVEQKRQKQLEQRPTIFQQPCLRSARLFPFMLTTTLCCRPIKITRCTTITSPNNPSAQ